MLAGDDIAGGVARGRAEASNVDGEDEARLTERVERALCATGYGPLRGIEVTVRARLVILGGRVPSYHLKQVAQATASAAVPGAHRVRNDLDVGRPN